MKFANVDKKTLIQDKVINDIKDLSPTSKILG